MSNIDEVELGDLDRKASSVTLTTLYERPGRRRLECNPFDQIDFSSRESYQTAAEGFIRGMINSTPCDSCARGVELHTRGLPVYPECVSVPLEDDADVDDPETRWLMKGACMNCHHRGYTNCSCRESPSIHGRHIANSIAGTNRLDQHGNAAAPRSRQGSLPSVPSPSPAPRPGDSVDSPIKLEGSPEPSPVRSQRARPVSIAMTDAPPPPAFPAGVITTRSRSSYIREPSVDYSNPEVAERVAQMHEQRAREIRAGFVTHGSPSSVSSESSFSSLGSLSSAIRGPGRRVVTPRSVPMAPPEEEPSPSVGRGRGASRGAVVRRTEYGGTHIRFSSDGDGSGAFRGRGGGGAGR